MIEPFQLFGTDLFGNPVTPARRGPMATRFEMPPFSVLDARSGEWQERKRAWLALGIQSEVGRNNDLLMGTSGRAREFDYYRKESGSRAESKESTTSVFDPVLCELAYRWFCPPGGRILDPFAGGSVRGIVASVLGFRYWGCDLRPEQCAANEAQAAEILSGSPAPAWVCADARAAVPAAPDTDFVFTCPPYGDLEKYSDDPADLSAMTWPAFAAAYREIIAASLARLKPNRFAAIVVGEFRDPKTGFYRGFVPYTCAAFLAAGAGFYNEAILVTPAGTLPMRAGKQFAASRKLGKGHQQMLVFVKGDPAEAARACGVI